MKPALLAPVPIMHLESGLEVVRREGRVAFGSNAWEVFRDLDEKGSQGCPVLIYASHTDAPPVLRVTWRATYQRYVESRGGAHPERMRFRPPTTTGEDDERFWAGFYEVTDLERLASDDQVAISNLRDRNGKRYGRGFVPEGPIVIEAPS